MTGITPLAAQDPTEVGPFRTSARIGVGGMGVVYLASGPGGEQVALKVMRQELADQPSFRSRFAREVAAARAVQSAFTAQLIDASTDSSPQWIASEYVPGPTVAEHVEARGPLPAGQVRLLGLGLADALQAIHAAGLIHRDLKPSNVIMGVGGPKVIDFGIAHAADATSITQTGAYVGSLAWMSPEQVTGAELTAATDVFSWGLVVAYAALGRHPYGEGRPEAVAFRMVNQPPDLDGMALNMRRAVLAALTTDPRLRASTQQLRALLMADQGEADDVTRVISETWDATIVALPSALGVQEEPSAHPQDRVAAATTPHRWRRSVPAFVAGAGLALGAGAGAVILHQATQGNGADTTSTESLTATPSPQPEAQVPKEAERTPTTRATPSVTVTREAAPAPTVTETVSAKVGSVTVCDFTNPRIPTPNPAYPFDFMLSVEREGSADPAVKAAVRSVQEILAAGGYSGLTGKPTLVDGVYGRNTAHAVSVFQNEVGIVVDGRVGPQTWAALGNEYCWMFH